MVLLQVLSGKKAGLQFTSKHLPVRVGRSADADLSLQDPGVFPIHFQIRREHRDLICEAEPDALLTINGKPAQRAVLRSGDIIATGALNLAFSLAPARQASLRLREFLTWTALAALCVFQVWLIYHLNP